MERGVGLRVLVLDHCTPEPDKDAGSITAFGIMRMLQQLGCKVTFAPEDNYLFLDRYTTDLQRLGIECLYAPFVTSVEDYLRQRGDAFDLVLIFRFMAATRHLGDRAAPGAAGESRAPRIRPALPARAARSGAPQRFAHAPAGGSDQTGRARHHSAGGLHHRAQHVRAGAAGGGTARRARRGLRVGDRRAGDDCAVRVPARRRLHRGLPASAERRRRAVLRSRNPAAGAPAPARRAIPHRRQQSARRASRVARRVDQGHAASCPIWVRCWMACASASRRCDMARASRARLAPA